MLIAKNYLSKKEIKALERAVSGYFDYIEDLIDFSNNVTNGNTYEGKVIGLARDLDFNDANSYRNANDTTIYGDYNGDGTVQTIQNELTNTASIGFKPIGGTTEHEFNGVFDGNGFELINVYIDAQNGALFTNIKNLAWIHFKKKVYL